MTWMDPYRHIGTGHDLEHADEPRDPHMPDDTLEDERRDQRTAGTDRRDKNPAGAGRAIADWIREWRART